MSPNTIVKSAGLVLVGVTIAVLATGGTYALYNSSASLSSATIRSGTATLATSPTTTFTGSPLTPGSSVVGIATVSNSGDVPLKLRVTGLSTAATGPFAADLTVGVGIVASAGVCAVGTFVPTWSGTFASVVVGSIGALTVPVSGSALVCISVALSTSAANGEQGSTIPAFALTIGGVQQ